MPNEVISIAGFDPFLTEEMSKGSARKRVQVVLTQAPSEPWISCFESSRHAAKHRDSVEAHVVGNYIAFESAPEDIERHMKDLTDDVGAANAALALAQSPPPPAEPAPEPYPDSAAEGALPATA